MAGSFGLLRAWGFGSGEVARAVAMTGIWNQLSNLLLPVVAVTLLAHRGRAGRRAHDRRDRRRGRVHRRRRAPRARPLDGRPRPRGRRARAAARQPRCSGVIRRGPVDGWPDGVRRASGTDTVGLIRRRWPLLTLAAIAGNLAVFLVLLVSLRAVGIDSSEVTWIEAFAGWSLARALQLIPLTPGGVGPVELGLTGILVGLRRGERARSSPPCCVYRRSRSSRRCCSGSRRSRRGAGSARARRGRSRGRRGESSRRVKEQSHKDEMSQRSAATSSGCASAASRRRSRRATSSRPARSRSTRPPVERTGARGRSREPGGEPDEPTAGPSRLSRQRRDRPRAGWSSASAADAAGGAVLRTDAVTSRG